MWLSSAELAAMAKQAPHCPSSRILPDTCLQSMDLGSNAPEPPILRLKADILVSLTLDLPTADLRRKRSSGEASANLFTPAVHSPPRRALTAAISRRASS
mmetsp:Transcript_101730/g.303605  ORF Transcript_101730/g.303605 Transcript_101730/m.303605 type:complete len:100 (+) Transcript_101730:979-1278(+)